MNKKPNYLNTRYHSATCLQYKCEYDDNPNKGRMGGYSLSNFLPRKEIGILQRVATKKRVGIILPIMINF
jgi:hypothetical protein